MSLTTEIKELAIKNGAKLVGIGDMKEIENCDYKYAISFAISVPKSTIKLINESGPDESYMYVYKGMNAKLNEIMIIISNYLKEKGYDALAYTSDLCTYDENEFKTALPHKTAATRAGIGWVGKCDLLCTESIGPALRLGTVYTNADLISDTPINSSKCGDCNICKDICPAHAITGKNWDINVTRDELVNPKLCNNSMLEQMRKSTNVEFEICGRCFSACPYTKKFLEEN